MATQASFLTLWNRPISFVYDINVNISLEYHNDENGIKLQMSRLIVCLVDF